MAKYNLNKYTSADGLGFPLNFRRGNPNPLDNSSVWASLESAQAYAANDPVAYVGQILTVVDNTEGIATVYSIQDEAGTLKKVGTSPVGDESTITVAEDGTISLFGVAGLELTRTEADGSTTKIKYQPLLVDGKLTWVEPSATTVEGLAAEIEGIKTRLSAVETTVGNAESGLVKDVADNTTAIAGINTKIGTVAEGKTLVEMISDAQTAATYDDTALVGRVAAIEGDYLKASDKTALETKMAEDIATAKTETIAAVLGEAVPEDFDTLKEIAAWIQSDTTASAQLVTRVTNIENDYLKGADKTALQGDVNVPYLTERNEDTYIVSTLCNASQSLNNQEIATTLNQHFTMCDSLSTVDGFPLGHIILQQTYNCGELHHAFIYSGIRTPLDENNEFYSRQQVITKGTYLNIKHKGTYETIGNAYQELLSYIYSNHLSITSDIYEENLISYFATSSEDEHIIHIFVKVS